MPCFMRLNKFYEFSLLWIKEEMSSRRIALNSEITGCRVMILKKFSVFYILLLLCFAGKELFAQASLQRGVNISNANGNIISIQTGFNPQAYSLVLPLTSNP